MATEVSSDEILVSSFHVRSAKVQINSCRFAKECVSFVHAWM